MITYKIKYKIENEDSLNLLREYRIQFSNLVRYSYNRLSENKKKKDIELSYTLLNNINKLDSWFRRSALEKASYLYLGYKSKKIETSIIFGGKKNYNDYVKGKIDKIQYKENRIMNLVSVGEANQKGNRKLDINIENNKLILKLNKNNKIEILLPKLSKGYKKGLLKLKEESENKKIPYSIEINDKFIYIMFDEKILKSDNTNINLLNNRCLGIDLNPNYIGVSVLEFDKNKNNEYKILTKKCFDINRLSIKSNKSSDSIESRYINNKLNVEQYEIAKNIINISKSFNCKYIFIEDLSIKSKDNKKGKRYNRLVNNVWKRDKFVKNLKKRCIIDNIKLFEVYPQYSSIVGNLLNDSFDPINSSIEICRRGYNIVILKNKKFYPDFEDNIESILHHWKEMEIDVVGIFKDWKELFKYIKNSKIRYRVSLDKCKKFNVFRMNSKNSKIKLYNFI